MSKPDKNLDLPGQRIEWLMEDKGMTQAALAKTLGLSKNAISKIVSGKSKSPAAATLLKIAAHFDANPVWIMQGVGHPYVMDEKATTSEMTSVFEKLSPAHQIAILAAAKALS